MNYQLSPLEYESRNDITIPHDNMPPYVEVYIWECMEATREEQMESGEPPNTYYKVTFDYNYDRTPRTETYQVLENTLLGDACPPMGALPTDTREGYTIESWYDMTGKQALATDVVTNNMVYIAQWQPAVQQ